MTMNVFENVRKTMGWCPDASVAKKVLVTLPADEEFLSGGKGKNETDQIKTGWANIYRNYILLQTVLGVVGFGLAFLIFKYLFQMVFNQSAILKGTLIGIIISAFIIIQEWKQLNRVNQSQIGLVKKIFVQTFSQLAIFFAFIMLMTFTIGKDEPLQFMLSIFFPLQLIHYPLVVFWERKSRKTIYLVEEKLLRWRPVALPNHV
ncbi:hypothetical protein METP3_02453 [Methanosarcinales archaeon]|nr:hypothetical protein METP3_02453 [Methanosarcinales archaeon]